MSPSIKSHTAKFFARSRDSFRRHAIGTSIAANIHGEMGYQTLSKNAAAAAFWTNSLLATDAAKSIEHWLGNLAESSATIYDKAVDASYIEAMKEGATKALGGGRHRLFDDSHDLGLASV